VDRDGTGQEEPAGPRVMPVLAGVDLDDLLAELRERHATPPSSSPGCSTPWWWWRPTST
jgi:hypothetical protein